MSSHRGIRGDRVSCPVTPAALRRAVLTERKSASAIARDHDVSPATAARWLADVGLLASDPRIDTDKLRRMYLEDGASVRELAANFGVAKNLILRALAAEGIASRPRHARRPRPHTERISEPDLRRAYVEDRLPLTEIAARFGVSLYYVRVRVRSLDLVKRRGSHTPRTAHQPDELRRQVLALYDSGLSMAAVGARTGVSAGTVRSVLHAAQAPVRPAGPGRGSSGRCLVNDLYDDRRIVAILRRHGVQIPERAWHAPTPWDAYAPLPLGRELLEDLYLSVGLPITHIALLCGVGPVSVRSRLAQLRIPRRARSQPAPWSVRRRALTS